MQPEVIIVGAGLSGLCCAQRLHSAGVPFVMLEASDRVGGRVKTDVVDGFLLDHGFQVLLTAYPTAQQMLNYKALQLKAFDAGAMVWADGRLQQLSDPFRTPRHLWSTLRSNVGSLADKLRVLRLRQNVMSAPLEDLWNRPEVTTYEKLRGKWHFSERMIQRFFRPFIGGITLEPELNTSSRMFDFVMRMFTEGQAAVPETGMHAIPLQLAAALPKTHIKFNTRVRTANAKRVQLHNGLEMYANAVVVATEGRAAAALTGALPAPPTQSTTTLYFSATQAPIDQPILVLSGEVGAVVNNLAVMNLVAPTYAPPGAALMAVSILGHTQTPEAVLIEDARHELRTWFGPQVDQWTHLRSYRIEHALPAQPPATLSPPARAVDFNNGLFICGDHRDHASIEGAMQSGLRTADAILATL